ncbi:MAG TPA: SpoIIE family protein phosphatase [Holophaga sp.]|nr:SpoIIE family protein phosphatase [Holophaga sp.]
MSPSLRSIRWKLVLTSVFALVMALGSFWLNNWVYVPSDDQCTWRPVGKRVVIAEILPNGESELAGLLDGDELLSIHGRKVDVRHLADAQRFINAQPEGRFLVYTVLREGRILRLPVKMVKSFDRTSLLVLISGLAAWAMGLLVVVSSPSRKIARHFYYIGVVSLLVTVLSGVGSALDSVAMPLLLPMILSAALAMGLTPPLWLHFFLRFPHPFPLRTNRHFLAALYGFSLGGGILLGLRLMLRAFDRNEFFQEIFLFLGRSWLGTVVGFITPAVAVTGLVLFWIGTFKLQGRKRAALLPTVLFTTAIMADLFVYNIFLRSSGASLIFQRESWIFFLPLPLLPLSFAYAIFRHGFFDVRRALLRWITYFAVLGLTLALYLGGLAYLFAQGIQVVPSAWVGVLVGISAIPIGWLLRWLMQLLRRAFRRDLHTAREVILGDLRESRKRFSEEALLAGLAESVREAYRPHVLLMLPVVDRRLTLPAVAEPDPDEPFAERLGRSAVLELPLGLVRHARENRELVLGLGSDEADWVREQGEALRAHVDALEVQVMALILVGDEPHAALLLGGKYAELNYGREDRELLREVAIAAGQQLETAVLHRRMLDQGRIEQELQTARAIQESLITSVAPDMPGFQAALRLTPALETGGDLLWVGRRPSGRWIAAVGDVSGKGLAAALYMSQAMALLKMAAHQEDMSFEEILPALDRTLRSLMGPRDFLTLSLLEWDAEGRYKVARAGHPPAILVSGSQPGDAFEIGVPGRGLGLRPWCEGNWRVEEGVLNPRQWLVMYSDGLTEAMNKGGELYGVRRFRDQVQRIWGTGSVRAACEAVFHDVTAFDAQNRDDRTLFILARDSA